MIKIIVVALIVGSILLTFIGIHINTGNGEQTGYITAVEKSGLIWKTGTAYIKTDLSSSQEDTYCVTDEDIYNILKEKSVNKEKVTISHFSWLSAGITNCNGEGAIINSIR